MKFQRNRMIQTQENDKKPHFGLDLGPLHPNSGHFFFFFFKSGFSDGCTDGWTDGQTDESDSMV